jgi:hypothetical protein
MAVLGLDVLGVGIEFHAAAQFHGAGIGIVFGVIGAQQLVFVAHLYVAIGDVTAAFPALLVGFELDGCAPIRGGNLGGSPCRPERQ